MKKFLAPKKRLLDGQKYPADGKYGIGSITSSAGLSISKTFRTCFSAAPVWRPDLLPLPVLFLVFGGVCFPYLPSIFLVLQKDPSSYLDQSFFSGDPPPSRSPLPFDLPTRPHWGPRCNDQRYGSSEPIRPDAPLHPQRLQNW